MSLPCVFPLNPCHVCLADDRAEVGQGDLRWKRETEFLSVFLADKPNIFSTFPDALSIAETGFFSQKCCKKESADLTNVNFKGGNYGG